MPHSSSKPASTLEQPGNFSMPRFALETQPPSSNPTARPDADSLESVFSTSDSLDDLASVEADDELLALAAAAPAPAQSRRVSDLRYEVSQMSALWAEPSAQQRPLSLERRVAAPAGTFFAAHHRPALGRPPRPLPTPGHQ